MFDELPDPVVFRAAAAQLEQGGERGGIQEQGTGGEVAQGGIAEFVEAEILQRLRQAVQMAGVRPGRRAGGL